MSYQAREWYYKFREIENLATPKKLDKIAERIHFLYSKRTVDWSKNLNSEWVCRTYFSAKMILNATVLLMNAKYADLKNIRIVRPYLEYYAILSLLRCVVYTLPTVQWNGGALIKINHNSAICLACSWVSRFNRPKSIELETLCRKLKAQRELISYRAPASGDINVDTDHNIIQTCELLADIAHFNSVLLEDSVRKNVNPTNFAVLQSDIELISKLDIDGFKFQDNLDAYQLDYFKRKKPFPSNLLFTMPEGFTEDFIFAWDQEDDDEVRDIFRSGGPWDWQLIFNVP